MTTTDMNADFANEIVDVFDSVSYLSDELLRIRKHMVLKGEGAEGDLDRLIGWSDTLVVLADSMAMEFFGKDEHDSAPDLADSVIADEIRAYVPEEWTTKDLAKASGVNVATLDRILTGETTKPQARTLRKIEAALGMEKGHLDDQ